MKKIKQKQRFDLIAALAALGILLMLGFESIFVFELYRIDPARVAPYLPASLRARLEAWSAPAESVPEEPAETAADAPAETPERSVEEPPAVTNPVPQAAEEPEPAPAPEATPEADPAPVG